MLNSFQRAIKAAGFYAPDFKFSLIISVFASIIQAIVFTLLIPLLQALTQHPIDTNRVWTLIALMTFLVIRRISPQMARIRIRTGDSN